MAFDKVVDALCLLEDLIGLQTDANPATINLPFPWLRLGAVRAAKNHDRHVPMRDVLLVIKMIGFVAAVRLLDEAVTVIRTRPVPKSRILFPF